MTKANERGTAIFGPVNPLPEITIDMGGNPEAGRATFGPVNPLPEAEFDLSDASCQVPPENE